MGTDDTAEDVAFIRVLMFHAEVGENGGFVLADCIAGNLSWSQGSRGHNNENALMHLFYANKLIRVDEFKGRASDKLVWLIAFRVNVSSEGFGRGLEEMEHPGGPKLSL